MMMVIAHTNWELQLTKIRRNEPFRTVCIPDLIYQYYGLAGRGEASVTAALDEFRKVPLNLIALACNAVGLPLSA